MLKEILDTSIVLASYYHAGQRDKNDENYILHPLRVMFNVDTLEAKCVAILHDVLEDTECSIEELELKINHPQIIAALLAITRLPNEKYEDYIIRVKKNKLARTVKIADLNDNLSRKGASESLIKRYKNALRILN